MLAFNVDQPLKFIENEKKKTKYNLSQKKKTKYKFSYDVNVYLLQFKTL